MQLVRLKRRARELGIGEAVLDGYTGIADVAALKKLVASYEAAAAAGGVVAPAAPAALGARQTSVVFSDDSGSGSGSGSAGGAILCGPHSAAPEAAPNEAAASRKRAAPDDQPDPQASSSSSSSAPAPEDTRRGDPNQPKYRVGEILQYNDGDGVRTVKITGDPAWHLAGMGLPATWVYPALAVHYGNAQVDCWEWELFKHDDDDDDDGHKNKKRKTAAAPRFCLKAWYENRKAERCEARISLAREGKGHAYMPTKITVTPGTRLVQLLVYCDWSSSYHKMYCRADDTWEINNLDALLDPHTGIEDKAFAEMFKNRLEAHFGWIRAELCGPKPL